MAAASKADIPPVEEIESDGFRDRLWRTARKSMKHVPFVDEVIAAYYCALDSETPLTIKATISAALVYFVLPADVIPDFIVGFGFSDDLAVLTAAIAAIRGHVKPAHREAARKVMEGLG